MLVKDNELFFKKLRIFKYLFLCIIHKKMEIEKQVADSYRLNQKEWNYGPGQNCKYMITIDQIIAALGLVYRSILVA